MDTTGNDIGSQTIAAHTPGPWHAWDTAGDTQGRRMTVYNNRTVIAQAYTESDAALIAAAPALLAALRDIMVRPMDVNATSRESATWQFARAALAKATEVQS